MILTSSSPLRTLPSELDARQRYYLDGIRFSIETAEVAFDLLVASLEALSDLTLSPGSVSERAVPQAIHAAWALVDSLNRLRVLLDQLPNVRHKDPWYQLALRRLEPIRDLRNPIQHLDGEFKNVSKGHAPLAVWGTLSWIRRSDVDETVVTSVLYAGTAQVIKNLPMENPVGHPLRRGVDRIRLTGYGASVALTEVMLGLTEFVTPFEDVVRQQFGASANAAAGSDLVLHMILGPAPPVG